MGVRADVLLRGAWYALEQSGLLQLHSVTLHSSKAYGSSVALVMLAREELGRCNILLDLWRRASSDTDVSVEDVQSACDDHVKKQREGQLSLMYRAEGETRFANLLRARAKARPGTAEFTELDEQLQTIDDLKAKRTPADRHSTRMKAMYVDINEAGTDWNRPSAMSESEATNCLIDALNDYSVKADRLRQLDMLKVIDAALATAIGGWPERPSLPSPTWPEP